MRSGPRIASEKQAPCDGEGVPAKRRSIIGLAARAVSVETQDGDGCDPSAKSAQCMQQSRPTRPARWAADAETEARRGVAMARVRTKGASASAQLGRPTAETKTAAASSPSDAPMALALPDGCETGPRPKARRWAARGEVGEERGRGGALGRAILHGIPRGPPGVRQDKEDCPSVARLGLRRAPGRWRRCAGAWRAAA